MYRFSFPTLIHFGAGVRRQLPEYLKTQNLKRPLIVTDKGVAGLPLCREIEASLGEAGLKVSTFSGIWGNPVKSQVTAGVEAYRAHQADGIVGLGGGAALDVAKAIALMIHHPGDLFDYEDDLPGARPVDQKIPIWVALPTTSGTGSEVGRSAVISDDQTHVKKIIFSPRLLAPAVFADPELTLDLPPKITAATGMDALTHCVEAYLAKGYHPICDGIALEGIRLAGENLVTAVKEPKNIEARSAMMMASMMGAIAFQKGLGVTHSCAHALGTVVDMHHGLANGVMIDHALKLNADAVPGRFHTMAVTVGLENSSPNGFLAWLKKLKAETGIPQTLTEAGVSREKLSELVELAVKDVCHGNNPVPVREKNFRDIFEEAF
jgi:alcohol dehydrogenase class IV